MRKVFVARRAAEAHVVQGLLESDGIAAMIRGGVLGRIHGAFSVWVVDDAQAERAEALIAAFNESPGDAPAAEAWTCPRCGEAVESQFTECWSCGSLRPAGKS